MRIVIALILLLMPAQASSRREKSVEPIEPSVQQPVDQKAVADLMERLGDDQSNPKFTDTEKWVRAQKGLVSAATMDQMVFRLAGLFFNFDRPRAVKLVDDLCSPAAVRRTKLLFGDVQKFEEKQKLKAKKEAEPEKG